jgi:hypothetical protein
MAVFLLAEPIADRRENGPGAGAGIPIVQPGSLAHLPDEVVDLDGVCLLLPAA